MLRALFYAGDFGELTSFFSIQYLILFLPAAIIGYTLLPGKAKKYGLLLGSLLFYFLISRRFICYILLNIVSIWLLGMALGWLHEHRDREVKAAEKSQRKRIKGIWRSRSRWVLGLGAAAHIGLLLTLKYSGFFVENVNAFLGTKLTCPSFVIPIGISFFSLQAVSYLVDVYRELIPPDRNVFRLGLFLSFFPQIVEGPICRYGQTAHQLWDVKPIAWANLVLGLQRILYGLLKKLVIADRLNAFVDAVFSGYTEYSGSLIAIAAVCYTIQLYMDFSGAMDAVCGTAQIFGVTMPENFQRPFFSRTISEFWSRWHISLGAWFKDYIFYPVTMAKPMKNLTSAARKKLGNHFGPLVAGSVALFCVWFSNGLWHGAAWNFIFFGMYHFVLILMGNVLEPSAKWTREKLRITSDCKLFRGFQVLRTCILVVVGELFFRAEGLGNGLLMFWKMVTDFRFASVNKEMLVPMGIDFQDFLIVGITLVIVFTVSLMNERGICVRQKLQECPVILRWAILYGMMLYILLFGAYGVGYVPVDPMYAVF